MVHLEQVGLRFGRISRDQRTLSRLLHHGLARWRSVNSAAVQHDFWTIRDVNLEIHPGECLGLVGVNGAGKTTLMRLIAGIYRPTTGRISIRGATNSLLSLQSAFKPELTGVENIRLSGMIQGLSRDQIEDRIDGILRFAELGDHAWQPVRTYSSGMSARLGFAVATAVRPDVLLVDEILSVGDGRFRERCFRRLDALVAQARAICLCSHQLGYLRRRCHRVVWLDHGQVVMDGPTRTVLAAYESFLTGDSLEGS